MEKRIFEYMLKNEMISGGDVLCAGVSGGADSVFLLRYLKELSTRNESVFSDAFGEKAGPSFTVMAVHVNHELRGKAADEDEAFVRELCEELDVPLFVYHYPVAKIAAERGTGMEEAGRLMRQEAYRDCVKTHGASRIALAHHANDLAETFLFHAARGTSAAGLAGIRPVQELPDMTVIHPLLCVTRQEIEEWMRTHGCPWCMDATNEEDSYTRNGIRHHVIPYLEEHVNAQTVRHIAETAGDLAEIDTFLQEEAARRAKGLVKVEGDSLRISGRLLEEAPVMQGCILLQAMEQVCGRRKDLGRVQVRQLQELFTLQTGRRIDLPYGMLAVRGYEGITLCRKGNHSDSSVEMDPAVITSGTEPAESGTCVWGSWEFRYRVYETDSSDPSMIPEKQYTKWLDYDKIRQNLVLRSRQSGDFFVTNAESGTQKLKKYLIDEKIPQEHRDEIPLLASGSEIWWIVGGRISEAAKVTPETRRILEITAERI